MLAISVDAAASVPDRASAVPVKKKFKDSSFPGDQPPTENRVPPGIGAAVSASLGTSDAAALDCSTAATVGAVRDKEFVGGESLDLASVGKVKLPVASTTCFERPP